MSDNRPADLLEYETLLSGENFDALAQALNVVWPGWYRMLVLSLLTGAKTYGDWLPGGFLYGRPWLIYRDTQMYREGSLRLYQEHSKTLDDWIPWPESFVKVGHYGGGGIVLDASLEKAVLLEIEKENSTLRRFIDVAEDAGSVEQFAGTLLKM